MKSENACYHSVQNILSSNLLSKNLKIKIYRNIIWPVVLYGCETWSVTLREERRPRVFENRVLRLIFGTKRDELTREWRKLHNGELNDLYCSLNMVRVIKSRIMRRAGHIACIGEKCIQGLGGKTWGKEVSWRPRCRWEDNIKMSLQEVGWGHGLDWSGSGYGQMAGTCECSNEPSYSIKCGEYLDWLSICWLLTKNSAPWSHLKCPDPYIFPAVSVHMIDLRMYISFYASLNMSHP